MERDIKYKAVLYGIPLFLSPFADKIIPILFEDKWPSTARTIGCCILGVIAASIGLRAYFDGSYERGKIDNKAASDAAAANGNGHSQAPAAPVVPSAPAK